MERDDLPETANSNNDVDQGDAGLSVVGVPWNVSQCRLCGNWYTLAKDFVRHYEDAHPAVSYTHLDVYKRQVKS